MQTQILIQAKRLLFISLFFLLNNLLWAQDKPQISFRGDIATSYMWRGVPTENSSIAFMPEVTVGWKGAYIGGWNLIYSKMGYMETALYVGYDFNDHLGISLTDNYSKGIDHHELMSRWGRRWRSGHVIDAHISYTISERFPLTIGWSTIIAGKKDREWLYNEEDQFVGFGKRYFSSYFELTYDFSIANWIDMQAVVGAVPFSSPYFLPNKDVDDPDYPRGFHFSNLTLRAEKKLLDLNHFDLAIWGTATYNPTYNKPYFVLGLVFNVFN